MSVSEGYKNFVTDSLSGLGPVRVRNMFGGGGVFLGDVMFALIADETLYLKADKTTEPDFVAEGMAPFTYEAKGKRAVMSYWRVPDRLLDCPEDLIEWAGRALAIAEAAKRKTGAKRKS